MERELAIINLKKVSSGDRIIVKGKVPSEADSFAVSLGQNASNYLIHFKARFDWCSGGCGGVIVCNSKADGEWGPEMQTSHFPFQRGAEVEISFLFEGKQVRVYFPDELIFLSKLSLNHVDYVSVEGDLNVQSIRLE